MIPAGPYFATPCRGPAGGYSALYRWLCFFCLAASVLGRRNRIPAQEECQGKEPFSLGRCLFGGECPGDRSGSRGQRLARYCFRGTGDSHLFLIGVEKLKLCKRERDP